MNLRIFITFSKQENCVQKYREVGCVKARFSGLDYTMRYWFLAEGFYLHYVFRVCFDLLYIVFFCCYTSFFYAFKGNDFSQ